MLLSDYFFEDRQGIKLLKLKNSPECEEAATKLVYSNTDPKTAIFLSGGSTSKKLYEKFTREGILEAGAVGLTDERYGEKWHDTSSEKMINETGLLAYLRGKQVSFYPILNNKKIEEEAENYDETLHYLFSYFPKSIAILGIGADGHTAGLPAGIPNLQFSISNLLNDPSTLAVWYSNPKRYGDRITMTYLSLSQMDVLLILALGTEKREALKAMFTVGKIEEIPSRFYLIPEIAKKTILITDQKI